MGGGEGGGCFAWVELDDPATVAHKDRVLPAAGCPGTLVRRGIRWADALLPASSDAEETLLEGVLHESIAAAAASVASANANAKILVIYEGVFMYLPPDVMRGTLLAVQRALPKHRLVCDLMSAHVRDVWSRRIRRALAATSDGASFVGCTPAPWSDVEQLGYTSRGFASITEEACRRRALWQPACGLHVPPFRRLRRGYAVWTFDFIR